MSGRRICPGFVSMLPSPVNGRQSRPRRLLRSSVSTLTTMSSWTLRAPAIMRTGKPSTSS
jgi:hypothetical protein